VRVDPNDEFAEYNEDNNEAHRPFKPIVARRLPLSREFDGTSRVFALAQNCPNPFTFGTDIAYTIPKSAVVTLGVYDSAGRVVKTLVTGQSSPGYYEANWDGRDEEGALVENGVYFYRLESGDFTSTKKMVLLK
jgi:hypothetical protein